MSFSFCIRKYYEKDHATFTFEKLLCSNLSESLYITADPLGHIAQAYREHLLEKALYALVTPQSKDSNNQAGEVHQYTQLLADASVMHNDNVGLAPTVKSSKI